ncbi:MAG: sulfatase-like hydrolase/transferase, partial [Tannerellaceae bacterium]|nr:sulfatase-like hydrolase/transferase [Tannerellaceae bacterium]
MTTKQQMTVGLTSSMFLFNSISVCAVEKSTVKPNFIIINCDDLGYGDLACFGHPTIATPHLDKMAFEGQKWTNFYVSSAVSSPSRSGLLTGRLGIRTGMYGNEREVLFPDSPKGLPPGELTIASLLKEAGYVNACVGKWHLGHQEESMPWNHGFDYFFGLPFSNDMSRKEQQKNGNQNYRFELPFYDQQQI